jgi:tetratricopeptide (TPR) repeat protein
LHRLVFSGILAAALAARAAPADTGQLDASPSLFTVMAAVNAAGYDDGLTESPVIRSQIREELAKRKIPSLDGIREFVSKHRHGNAAQELAQYVSFALSSTGPPNFEFKQRDVDIPPDVSGMTSLSPLLAAFYKEANIEELWKRSQPAIDQYIGRIHTPISEAVLQVNLYLRQPTSGYPGRRFQIFVELQGAPNQIQTRSYGNEYTIVVTPSEDPRTFDIRHGYLHYLLDPMATRNQEVLLRKKGLADHAQRAQALEDSYKEDFLLLATESLIKAVEARLDKNPQWAQAALRQGYILTPFFVEQLPVYEKQEASMMVYYKEMVSAIELKKEDARLAEVQFDRSAPAARVVKPVAQQPAAPALTGAAKTLDAAENLYRTRDLEKAKALFLAAIDQADQRPLKASAYYGLARVATLQKDPETAERLFQKTLELEPEPQVKAWALVYLGQLELAAKEGEQAAKYFQSALEVEGASELARQKAREGLQTAK